MCYSRGLEGGEDESSSICNSRVPCSPLLSIACESEEGVGVKEVWERGRDDAIMSGRMNPGKRVAFEERHNLGEDGDEGGKFHHFARSAGALVPPI